jgi:asparagine synthase (glutamine-hydrolysing)
MGAWFKGALAPLVRQMLSPEAIERRGLFDPRAVSELIAAHDANRVDGTDRLLALLNFEIWARLYLEGRAPEDVVDEIKVAAA